MARFSIAERRWLQRREQAAEVYRGEDRRGVIAADTPSPGKLFVVVGFGLLALALIVFVGSAHISGGQSATLHVLIAQLEAGAFALSLLLAALCFVRWRLVGEAGVLWIGTAAATYGLVALGLGYLEALSEATSNDGLLWLQPAGRLVVIALFVIALLAPEVDATLRPSRTLVTAAAAVALVAVVLQMFPTAAALLVTPGDTLAGGVKDSTGAALFALLWSGLGIWTMWVGLHGRRHLLAWAGLLFVALGFRNFAWLLPTSPGSLWSAGPAVLGLVGLICAVMGATSELARAYVKQGSRLLESVASERTAEARIEAELATQAERAHEASNALSAIEGATRTLQRYQDQLDAQTRSELAEAVSEEVHRLQQLICATSAPPAPGRFRLTEALAAVVTSARSQGAVVTLDVPNHLVAVGQPADTAQVLHNLLLNARRYAGGEIRIRAGLEGEHVVIRVEDDGPGISAEERESIFARGVRGSTAAGQPGSGLGLYISARLMREQGGKLNVEEASGRQGACFAVRLPGFSELPVDEMIAEQATDDRDQAGELVVAEEPIPLFARNRDRGARRIQHEDGVRHDVAR